MQGVTEEVFVVSREEALGFSWEKEENDLAAFPEVKPCRIMEFS